MSKPKVPAVAGPGLSEGLGVAWGNEPVPTHRCKVCGSLWRYWPQRDTNAADSWNLRSNVAGPCCDNVPMGEQIEPLTIGVLAEWLGARLAVDAFTNRLETVGQAERSCCGTLHGSKHRANCPLRHDA